MPSIQIRNISEEVYRKLVERAKEDKRSIQQEASWLLESTLQIHGYPSFFNAPLHYSDWTNVDHVRKEMSKRHDVQPDSTPLIREMRNER
jgi:hypothetical protein